MSVVSRHVTYQLHTNCVQCSSHNTEPLVSELNAQWEVWLQKRGICIRKAIKFHLLNLTPGVHLTDWWLHPILGTKGLTPYVYKITVDHHCGC